ncbi:MAG: ZIP family metal transporter [Deltaproteobacteria bacterium]
MASAFLWGLLAASSLVLGGLLASWVPLGKRTLGIILGFGAGVLLSATAYELVFEAVRLAKGSGFPGLGFLGGAATFFLADQLIDRFSNGQANTDNAAGQSTLVVPLVLGATLDGIPESVVIGLGLVGGGTVSLAMLVAVFMSNLPEAAAGTAGMRSSGWSRTKIFLLWAAIALVCALASAAGYALLGNLSRFWLSSVQAFAGGAILMMLANSMIPEAYEHGGKLAGVFTVLGFAVSVLVIVFEQGGAG